MIIIGYPGIGKSTLATSYNDLKGPYKGIIDLESSCFSNDHVVDPFDNRRKVHDDFWYIPYCQVAVNLSRQGYIVFVSSHANVCRELTKVRDEIKICHPTISLKEAWVMKLRKRYTETGLEKDHRAYERAVDHYEEDIKALIKYGFERVEIVDDSYKLGELLDLSEGPKCIGY